MAENFFTGLTGAIQQNAKQRNNDDYIELMRQKQLQSEMSGALADKRAAAADLRADEDMVMKREAAIRTQKDFDFRMSEAERKRAQEESFTRGSSDIYKRHFGPTPELDANGQEVKDEAGNVRMKTPNQHDPTLFGNYLRDFTGHLANHGKIAPEQLKQLTELKSAMEKDGTLKALQDWQQGDVKEGQILAKKYGLVPASMKMIVEKDKATNLLTPYLVATTIDGKPVKHNLAAFQMAAGLPVADPTASDNQRIIAGSQMANDSLRAQAAMKNADRPRGGGGGGGGDDGGPETGGLSLKAFNKEASLFNDNINQSQPRYSFSVGEVLGPDQKGEKVDEFKKEKLREFGMRALRSGAATNATDAQTIALRTFDAYESDALKNIRFTEDPKTRAWRVSYNPNDKTVPYNSRLVPEAQRIAGRNAAVEVRLREALERDRARTAAIKK